MTFNRLYLIMFLQLLPVQKIFSLKETGIELKGKIAKLFYLMSFTPGIDNLVYNADRLKTENVLRTGFIAVVADH